MLCRACNFNQEIKEKVVYFSIPYLKLSCGHLIPFEGETTKKETVNSNAQTPQEARQDTKAWWPPKETALPHFVFGGQFSTGIKAPEAKPCTALVLYQKQDAPAPVLVQEITERIEDVYIPSENDRYRNISSDGKFLLPFQIAGVKAVEEAYLTGEHGFIIADEQGLGKTIQSIYFRLLHPELGTTLLIVKSGLKAQWLYELIRWLGRDVIVQVIMNGEDLPLEGADFYIISFDMLRRFEEDKEIEVLTASGSRITKTVKTSPWAKTYELVIIDECQHIKNFHSKRTQAINSIAEKAKFVIGLSGTPIKNHAGEFFSIFHFVAPTTFPDEKRFYQFWVDSYFNGKSYSWGGIKPLLLEQFDKMTSKFLIRRTRLEVLPELPTVTRQFQHVDFDNKKLEKKYKRELLDLIDHLLNKSGSKNYFAEGIARLSRLRHICGINKINPTVEFTMDFLQSTDRKIVLFTHHIDVMDAIEKNLGIIMAEMGLCKPLKLHADLDSEQRQAIVEAFRLPANRVMIASTKASGEGLNLQFCSDCIIVERQWNPADEEQVEGRFIRIGQLADKVTAIYMIAAKTIDEYFTELVERKRAIIAQALDKKDVQWEESSLMRELFNAILGKG